MRVVGAVAGATVLLFSALAARTDAQVEPATVEPLSFTGAGPLPGASTSPVVSDDGSIVAFATDDGSGSRIAVRDRAAATTTLLDPPGSAPGLSGNGCVVAYPAPRAPGGGGPARVDLVAVDRCADAPSTAVVDTIDAPAVAAVPALSRNGSVIAWSHGEEVVRYRRDDAGAWSRAGVFDEAVGGNDASVTGPHVDVSDDGRTVVFEAGPLGAPFDPAPSNVHLWRLDGRVASVQLVSDAGGGTPGTGNSGEPTVSGDGSLVAYLSVAADLDVEGAASADVPFVVLDDRAGTARVLAASAAAPALSADGRHVVYRDGADLRAVRWADGTPADSPVDELVVADVGDLADPAVTRHGRWVVFASANGSTLTPDVGFHADEHVWVAELPPPSAPPGADLGAGPPGATLSTIVTVTNDASFGVPWDSVAVSSPFVVERTTCTGVLHPEGTCTVTLSVTIEQPGRLAGELTITTAGWSPIELVSPVVALGERPPTTTAPPTTSPPTTRPPTTRPPTTRPPVPSFPSFPSFPLSPGLPNFPGFPSGSTGGSTSSTLPGTTGANALPTLDRTSVVFEPTIVDAGRRVETLVLTDPDGVDSVAEVRLDPATEHFSIVATTCEGVVPAAGCTIEVAFHPTATGSLRATLVVELDDGRVVSAAVSGTGDPPPTLDVVPDVAAPGQVVTVVGDGFPDGAVLDLVWVDDRVVASVTTDERGSFRESVLVLPRTPAGPGTVRVPARENRFDVVRTTLLVGRRPGLPLSPALRGVGVNVGS